MNNYQFRAKPVRKDDAQMLQVAFSNHFKDGFVYGDLIHHSDKTYIVVSELIKLNCCLNNAMATVIEVDSNTVDRAIGVYDKYNDMIYTGDIVKYNGTYHRVVFEYRGGSAYFGIVIDHNETWRFCLEVPAKLMTVVGNIYDNPELLEVS